jgi:hypothetical protein
MDNYTTCPQCWCTFEATSAARRAEVESLLALEQSANARLRAEAANWRTVRDEVLRLDGRPGTMADDDVLSIVGAVLQRAVQSGEHRREEEE